MRRPTVVLLSLIALLSVLCGTAVATGNHPPLADAGLDQSVERGTTVHLDANGSRDPDGTISSVEWSIQSPDGTTRTPTCPTCVQTTFTPSETGQYNVTLVVTDDAGATRSDTLHVKVSSASGPSVSLSAPAAVPVGSEQNLQATATAGNASLRTFAWVLNGSTQDQTQLSGTSETATVSQSFDSPGSVSVRAVVYDAAGHRATANQTVQVVDSSGGGGVPSANRCPGGTSNYYNSNNEHKGCTTGSSMTIDDTVVDVDGKPGVWMYVNSELTKVVTEESADKLSRDGRGDVFSREVINQEAEEVEQEKQEEWTNNNRNDNSDDSGSSSDNGGSDNDSGGSDDDDANDGAAHRGATPPRVSDDMDDDDGGDNGNVKDNDNFGSDHDFSYNPASRSSSTGDSDSSSDGSSSNSDDSGSSSDEDDDDGGGFFGGIFDGIF
ncbi:MAG: PKD domain-containing protein [Haloarcula sp.]